jgi:hypothetical protein
MTMGRASTAYRKIPGWFGPVEHDMFSAMLRAQDGITGTLVELGVYLGRSAVVIGAHQRRDERFLVIDLFGSEAVAPEGPEWDANRTENQVSYPTLTRSAFERNYLRVHPELPEVVQDLTSVLPQYVAPGSARFVHVDASHLHAQVADDIANSAIALRPDGVIVLDDYRGPHTPGVAAAAWGAVHCAGLVPFALTTDKMYATWGDPQPYRAAVRRLLTSRPKWSWETQRIADHEVIRLGAVPAATAGLRRAASPSFWRAQLSAGIVRSRSGNGAGQIHSPGLVPTQRPAPSDRAAGTSGP